MTHLPASVAMWQYWFYATYVRATGMARCYSVAFKPFHRNSDYGFYSARSIETEYLANHLRWHF